MNESTSPLKTGPDNKAKLAIAGGAVGLAAVIVALVLFSESRANHVALASEPRPVSTVRTIAGTYLGSRTYVGTLEPWLTANIGPQFVAAYVETVRVRPGELVKKGDVLATLDCRNVSSATKSVAARTQALDAHQRALANEVRRMHGLVDHGFVSTDDLEQKSALSLAETDQLAAEQAHLVSMDLQVDDCILRAPFDGEITGRTVDPGAFVRPGASIVTLMDRHLVRFTADVPERDFRVVREGKTARIHVEAVDLDLEGTIARRTPSADLDTRTVHFEADLENTDRAVPVNVTGVATIDVGEPVPATELPLRAATVKNGKATVFVAANGVARSQSVPVLGERAGVLFVDSTLAPGAAVVTEGRTLLADGDAVREKAEPFQGEPPAATPATVPAAPIARKAATRLVRSEKRL